jgi:hypothetical protein
MANQEEKKFANHIIQTLDETDKTPVAQIHQIIELAGIEFAQLMLDVTHDIQADGGLYIQDGSRKRTIGGVFFYLVRGALPSDIREIIFPNKKIYQGRDDLDIIKWEKRLDYFKPILDKPKGEVEEVHINLTGRPITIESKNHMVMVTLQAEIARYLTFPKGLPDIPEEPTTFFVYIDEKQWKKHVKEKLKKDKNAAIVVEGAPAFDPEMGGIAIFAQAVSIQDGATTKREEKRHTELTERAIEEKRKRKEERAKQKETKAKQEKQMQKMSPELAKKLKPLYGARNLFRKRLADIEALPQEKQSGLKAAKMALERTEKQIAALEAKAKEPTADADNDDKPE